MGIITGVCAQLGLRHVRKILAIEEPLDDGGDSLGEATRSSSQDAAQSLDSNASDGLLLAEFPLYYGE